MRTLPGNFYNTNTKTTTEIYSPDAGDHRLESGEDQGPVAVLQPAPGVSQSFPPVVVLDIGQIPEAACRQPKIVFFAVLMTSCIDKKKIKNIYKKLRKKKRIK